MKKTSKRVVLLTTMLLASCMLLTVLCLPIEAGAMGLVDSRLQLLEENVFMVIGLHQGYYTLGYDGKVRAHNVSEDYHTAQMQREIQSWEGIWGFRCVAGYAAGYDRDGAVHAVGFSDKVMRKIRKWKSVDQAAIINGMYGPTLYALDQEKHKVYSVNVEGESDPNVKKLVNPISLVGVTCDEGGYLFGFGKGAGVYWAGPDPYGWTYNPKGIKNFATSGWLHAALSNDGTVTCAGTDRDIVQSEVSRWRNVKKVLPGDSMLVALNEAGYVHFAGIDEYNSLKKVLSTWNNMDGLFMSDLANAIVGKDDTGWLSVVHWNHNYGPNLSVFENRIYFPYEIFTVAGTDLYTHPKLLLLDRENRLYSFSLN